MTKQIIWVLAFCIFFFAVGALIYWRLSRTRPPRTTAVSNWPSVPPATPPTASTAPGKAAPVAPPVSELPAKKENASAEPEFALRPGETLEYAANLPKLNSTVANLKIVAVEKRNNGRKGSWHLQAVAHTENPYRMVFQLDDQFDSYSDAASMTSVQYEMHLSERGQTAEIVERMLTSPTDPPPMGISGVRVLPGTRDPLGMLEYMRGVDWSRTSEVHSPVFDGHKLYQVRAVMVGKSVAVSVPAGKFDTTKIEIHVLDDGVEMKDAHFFLYLVNDPVRLPVLLEAVLPVATARVELTKTPQAAAANSR
jgi:Protein of unknown function (DUF3108)